MKLLLADDTEINRLYLGEALGELGCTVQLSVDGRSALECARRERFDLLVLDIRMPHLFGDEVLEQLRADPSAASQHTPAVAVSSELDTELRVHLEQRGFVAALAKPVQAAEVLAAVGWVPPAGAAQPPRLDDAQALRALGNPETVRRLRAMLADELRVRRADLDQAMAAQDAARLREWIHQLRGACALCGAARLDAGLQSLRTQVLQADWTRARGAATNVAAEMDQLQLELAELARAF